MNRVLLLLSLLLPSVAQGQWVYEFEFDFTRQPYVDRLLDSRCTKVVPVSVVAWYAVDPRAGWEISCGNRVPFYNHFLGRQCWRPLPKFTMECGWRHFSSPRDNHEISYDALAVRGRFEFSLRRDR